jgi:tyrosyl-tRNA synthetase
MVPCLSTPLNAILFIVERKDLMNMKLYDELKWRGLIKDISSEELEEKLNKGGMTFYIGTDPTADSLHIGHYLTFLMAKRLEQAGHHPILLVGMATGLVGDPRGTTEREKADAKVIEANYEKLKSQVEKIFGIPVVNNYDWFKNMNYINFLRDVGKYINVGYMINKDLVKRQMESGISYAEFSYMLIQGYDFKYLHENRNVTLQIGGSDQWGNLTTGIELIRKTTGDEVYAFSIPLVTDSNGKKFGKSEGNAIWLDKNKTSSYKMYQYLINLEDSMMEQYLKFFTFLEKEEIEKIMKTHNNKPELRLAQKTLAKEIIIFLHGEEEYNKAVKLSEILFKEEFKKLTKEDVGQIFEKKDIIDITTTNLVDLLIEIKAANSKRESREFIKSNAIKINGEKINDLDYQITTKDYLDDKYIIVKRGKKNYYVGSKIN